MKVHSTHLVGIRLFLPIFFSLQNFFSAAQFPKIALLFFDNFLFFCLLTFFTTHVKLLFTPFFIGKRRISFTLHVKINGTKTALFANELFTTTQISF